MEKLLENAVKKFYSKNRLESDDYELSMDDFILKIYDRCDPGSYGKFFSNKLIYDLSKDYGRSVGRVDDSMDRGDIFFNYFPERYYMYDLDKLESTYYEIKLSFLGKNGNFTIRNLRFYQELDGYLITLVDCLYDFKPTFHLISKDNLLNNCGLTFTGMNGTKERNKNNMEIGYGTQFQVNSEQHSNLDFYNILDGTSYEDLMNHFKKLNESYKKKFDGIENRYKNNFSKFSVDEEHYFGNSFDDNYISFIRDISNNRGFKFIEGIIGLDFISKVKKDSFHEVKKNLFINMCSSKEEKKNHIINISKKIKSDYSFYTKDKIGSILDSELECKIIQEFSYGYSNEEISNYLKCDEKDVQRVIDKYKQFCKDYNERYEIAKSCLPDIFKLFKKVDFNWKNVNGESLMSYCNRYYYVDEELCFLLRDKYVLTVNDLEKMLYNFLRNKFKNSSVTWVSFHFFNY